MGYRWYDQQNITPLFAFGYGLSYTQFAYSGLKIRPDSGGLDVSFRVENTGSVRGSEAPQVYVGPLSNPPPGVQFALEKLVGFKRVQLNAGEGESVSVHVSRRELSYWSTAAQNWVLAGGQRTISVGASSRDIRLHGSARSGKGRRPREVGRPLRLGRPTARSAGGRYRRCCLRHILCHAMADAANSRPDRGACARLSVGSNLRSGDRRRDWSACCVSCSWSDAYSI